jgi:hypothetical protein
MPTQTLQMCSVDKCLKVEFTQTRKRDLFKAVTFICINPFQQNSLLCTINISAYIQKCPIGITHQTFDLPYASTKPIFHIDAPYIVMFLT